jgi:acetyltransferase
LRIVNPKEDEVQASRRFTMPGTAAHRDGHLGGSREVLSDYVEFLAAEKQVRAFIIISAGFGEETQEGAEREKRILESCERYGCALIGPNCIG